MKKILLSVLASAALLLVGSNVTTVNAATAENSVSAVTADSNKVIIKVTNPNGGRSYVLKDGSINLDTSRKLAPDTEWVGIPMYTQVGNDTILLYYQISTTEYALASDVTVVGMA